MQDQAFNRFVISYGTTISPCMVRQDPSWHEAPNSIVGRVHKHFVFLAKKRLNIFVLKKVPKIGSKLHHDLRCHPKLMRRKGHPNDSDAFDLVAEVLSKNAPKQSLPTVLWYIHTNQGIPNHRQALELFTEMQSFNCRSYFKGWWRGVLSNLKVFLWVSEPFSKASLRESYLVKQLS